MPMHPQRGIIKQGVCSLPGRMTKSLNEAGAGPCSLREGGFSVLCPLQGHLACDCSPLLCWSPLDVPLLPFIKGHQVLDLGLA